MKRHVRFRDCPGGKLFRQIPGGSSHFGPKRGPVQVGIHDVDQGAEPRHPGLAGDVRKGGPRQDIAHRWPVIVAAAGPGRDRNPLGQRFRGC